MPLVDSLLTAVVRSDGDALVLHVGEKPYVVAAGGTVELSRQGLGLGAMEGMLAQLLSPDALRALRDMGAVEYEIESRPAAAGDRFTVVAARGGDDVWIEIRRHRRLVSAEPVAACSPTANEALASGSGHAPEMTHLTAAEAARPEPVEASSPAPRDEAAPMPAESASLEDGADFGPMPAIQSPRTPASESEAGTRAGDADAFEAADDVYVLTTEDDSDVAPAPVVLVPHATPAGFAAIADAQDAASADQGAPPAPAAAGHLVAPLADAPPAPAVRRETATAPVPVAASESPHAVYAGPPVPRGDAVAERAAPPAAAAVPAPAWSDALASSRTPEPPAVERDPAPRPPDGADPLPAVVLSLTRDGLRNNGSTTRGPVRLGGIERLLRVAAARGASALYLTTQARPAVRVDGDIRLLEGEPPLSSGEVEAAVLELAPEGTRDKESAEWIRDLQDIGRVRITTFRDYRGPGALLRMIQAKATSAEQLGLVREIQTLATEPEGLVIVTGPRASGKSTLVSAFVDLINRQRNDHVITLEGQIRFVHESRGSLVSQRELRGSAAEVVTAARAALRENPDVLVIEDLRSPDVLQVALDAAGSGLLVFVSMTAASATAALERLVDLCPSEQRRTVRTALAEHLRGVVAQVLLRKTGGGRLAARELVLNTNAVAALIGDGQIGQLPRAIDSGRKLGMAPLNDALVAFVQSGAVDVREAYRKADDKAGFLALLRREGIDTSFVERLA